MSEMNPEKLLELLQAPFESSEVKFKPAVVKGNRALALPYVDARTIMDRLDAVLGVSGWQDEYEFLPDGSCLCRLRMRLGGEWITKMDVGGESEQTDEGDRRKAAVSDALKRASVKFGVGRYLYRQPSQWADYDPIKKQFTRTPQLPAHEGAKASPRISGGKPTIPAPPARPSPKPDLLTPEQGGKIDALCEQLEIAHDVFERQVHKDFGHLSPAQMTAAQADEVIERLEKVVEKRQVPQTAKG